MTWLHTPDRREPRPLPNPCALSSWSGTARYKHVCAEHGLPAKSMISDRNESMAVRFECGCEQTVVMKA